METPKTFKELFANTGIEPTTDESGNTHYNFKATLKEKPKQETLEEASEQYAKSKSSSPVFQKAHIRDFISGAKWQQEKMYSEEDMKQAFNVGRLYLGREGDTNFEQFIEQFKNK